MKKENLFVRVTPGTLKAIDKISKSESKKRGIEVNRSAMIRMILDDFVRRYGT